MDNINIIAKETLVETIKKIDGAYAPATILAYRANFERFIDYCDQAHVRALPADEADVANYIKHLVQENLKSASIRIAIASISAIHRLNQYPDTSAHPIVKLEMRRMHRSLGRESKQAAGINHEQLKRMLQATDNSLKGIRDRALLMTSYDTMCRRSELVSLSIDDAIIDQENQTIKIKLKKSKTDQYGLGRWLYLSEATQQAILDWLNVSDIVSGKLFRGIARGKNITDGLSSGQINRIYKQIVARTNAESATLENISGHSIRVGAAQDLLVSGASLPMIMQRGRWSKTDTVMRYLENSSLFGNYYKKAQ